MIDKAALDKEIKDSIAEFRKYDAAVKSKLGMAVAKAAMKVEADAKALFKGRDDDSVYGEPPRVDTGRLRASITHRVSESENPEAEIGTNVEYAYGLETGTSRTWPHPFLVPALEMNRDDVTEFLGRAMKEAENA